MASSSVWCARLVWWGVMGLRRAVHHIRRRGLANCLVFTFPIMVMTAMFYIGIFGHNKERVGHVLIVSHGQEASGASFDRTDPYRYCTNMNQDEVLNVIVLDESRVLPDFLIHDWIQTAMFDLVEPRRAVNMILERGDEDVRTGSGGTELTDDVRGPVIRRKGDAMVGEREREERKIHLWRDGRYKNLFCNNSIIVVQTKACSPVARDHQFVHKYLQQAQALGLRILGIIHSDDEYPDYRRKRSVAAVAAPASSSQTDTIGDDMGTVMAGQSGEEDDERDLDQGLTRDEARDQAEQQRISGGNAGENGVVLSAPWCSDRDWYLRADFVYRPYWSRAIKQRYSNVKWMPLGTRAGFGTLVHSNFAIPPASKRSHLCTFIGSISSRRDTFFRSLSKDGRCFVIKLRKEDYDIWRDRRLMLDSAITLAPSGVNRETHRIYEALEAGSIPIIDRTKWADYDNDSFLPFGEDCPLPSVKEDWAEELPALLNHLSDPEALDKKQREVIEWWKALRHNFQLDVKNTIAHAFTKGKTATNDKR